VCLPKEKDPWVWKNNLSDSAPAIENLLLSAWDKGLGTCWMTRFLKVQADGIAAFLGVPPRSGDRGHCPPWVPGSPALQDAKEGGCPENQMNRV
jgi:hypothetical protein